MSENKVGRPLTYDPEQDGVEKMQERIDAYFKECEGTVVTDANGDPIMDKYGNVIMRGVRPLSITGLALAIGFNSRQSLLNYQGRPEFMDTITRAKAKVEQYAEERLFDKDGANGAKFSLANNFDGWKEKQQIDANVNDVSIKVELVDE